MKKALILGLTGGYGSSVAKVLLSNGWQVRALVRSKKKVDKSFSEVELVQGDAANKKHIQGASEGVDVIVYGINVPYDQWESKSTALLEVSLSVARQNGLTVLYPENVYVFNPSAQLSFSPSSELDPPTVLGGVRMKMLGMLKEASAKGAQVIVVRGGDFIGELAPSSWFNRLIKTKPNSIQLKRPSTRDVKHTWAYLPDMARLSVSLLDEKLALANYHCAHFVGFQVTFSEVAEALARVTGKRVSVTPFPWWQLKLAALFVPLLKKVIIMRYLWDQPLLLENDCNEGVCEALEPTSLDDALRTIVAKI